MRMIPALLSTLLSAAALPHTAAAATDPLAGKFTIEEATKGLTGKGTLTATIQTNLGTFTCELYEADAPNTVANFVGLARGLRPFLDPHTNQWVKRPFYDGLGFHRVIPRFMIQGGDIKGNGSGDPGYDIKDETNGKHHFDRGGVLAMANRGPDTGGSQFFITAGETPFLDDGVRPPAHYQIFGQCAEADLVKKITALRGPGDRPTQEVKIAKVTIARGGKGAPKGGAPDAGKGKGKGKGKPEDKNADKTADKAQEKAK